MSARTRSRVAVLLCSLACGWAPSLRADPVLYSTSGTVAVDNEPDNQLYGVSGTAVVPDSAGQYALGSIRINPIDPFNGPPAPHVSDTPFDIRLDFNGGLPSLELKGVFNTGPFESPFPSVLWAYQGTVTSVTSSDPVLDAGLPAMFTAALADPDVLRLHIGMWDWGISSLPVTMSYEAFQTVPEPSTLLLFGAITAWGVRHARSNRRLR